LTLGNLATSSTVTQQVSSSPTTVKQVVRSLPDGRKRITPMLLTPQTPPSSAPMPLISLSPIPSTIPSNPPTPLSNEFAKPLSPMDASGILTMKFR
jgi:hypothetical protein